MDKRNTAVNEEQYRRVTSGCSSVRVFESTGRGYVTIPVALVYLRIIQVSYTRDSYVYTSEFNFESPGQRVLFIILGGERG